MGASLRAMPRDPDKKPFSGQLSEREDEMLLAEAAKRDWSKARMIERIVQWWLFDKGLLTEKPKGERP